MSVQAVERKLSAIFAADIAGYSRLMGQDEVRTLARLRDCREVMDRLIATHRGRIFNTAGDSVVADFASAVDAVQCAVAVQEAIGRVNTGRSEGEAMRFRIGIHVGDIIVQGENLFGDAVNVAARLEAIAEPGGICVSGVVREHIGTKLPIGFIDLGEQQVKNIARPVRAYRMSGEAIASTALVAAPAPLGLVRSLRRIIIIPASGIAALSIAIVAWWTWPKGSSSTVSVDVPAAASPQAKTAAANAPAPRLSIVVLPFANLSNNPDQEYFADAITEDLTTDLSRIAGSFVIAPTTAFTYRGKGLGAKQIGRELGVGYVLDGSVRRTGDHVQVNVQLIDAESGAQLWTERLASDRTDLVKAQREITGRIARSLNLRLTEVVGRRVERDGPTNPDAQDFLMRGWALYYRPASSASRQEARRDFQRALEIDPQSVGARIGIGTVLVDDLVLRFSSDLAGDKARAEEMLREALEREMNDSMAHFAMGMLRRIQNRLNDSQIELETAIALDRNNARAFQQLGVTLMCLGEPADAIPQIERAIRLNPHDPNIASYYWALGSAVLVSGRVDDAVSLLSKARAANPRLYFIHLWLAGSLALKGDLGAARSAVAASLELRPEVSSLARWRAENLFYTNPQFTALADKTVYAGLRQAGFPDE